MNKEKIQERIDALEAELEGLRAELEKPEKLIWKSGIGDEYYTVTATAKPYKSVYNASDYDLGNIMAYNAFKSKELAERVAKKQRVERKLIMLADTLNEGWKPSGEDRGVAIQYDLENSILEYLYDEIFTASGNVVFENEYLVDKAMSHLTAQDIQDYFLWQEGADDE